MIASIIPQLHMRYVVVNAGILPQTLLNVFEADDGDMVGAKREREAVPTSLCRVELPASVATTALRRCQTWVIAAGVTGRTTAAAHSHRPQQSRLHLYHCPPSGSARPVR